MSRLVVIFVVTLLLPASALAQQLFETAGVRALGMGGAFVGVADDPTAVYWNPAGLLSGGPAGVTAEWTRLRAGNRDGAPRRGPGDGHTTLWSVGTWPIGLSYGRFRSTAIADTAAGQLETHSLTTSHFGITLLQTLVENLVVGSTLKYVRGRAAIAPVTATTIGDALKQGAEIEAPVNGAFDLDVAVMADMERIRFGLTVRNLREPEFGETAENTIALQRRSRIGLAVFPATGVTLAIDLDLNTAELADGPRRMLAVGGESRLGARLAVRSGARWSLEGDRGLAGAVGASVAIRPGFWIDGHYTHGGFAGDRSFGIAMRAAR